MGVPESIKKTLCVKTLFGSVTYMNQLNFVHFNTNSNKISLKQYFFQKAEREIKTAPKRLILF